MSQGLDQILNPVIAEPEIDIDIITDDARPLSPRVSNLHGQFSQMNVDSNLSSDTLPITVQSVDEHSTQESNPESTGYANQVVRSLDVCH